MKYGNRLKRLRENKKLSQQQLADKLNINRSTYARYELNKTQPDYETLQKLAEFYNVSIDYILTGVDTKLTEKDERDIAKRMEKIKNDLRNAEGLSFHGEPLSEEAIESLLEAIEHAERIATLTNKKYISKKYRKN